MKKILLIAAGIAFAMFSFYAISGFVPPSSTEDILRKRIAELEKQVTDLKENATTCNYKYFDSESDLRKFIAEGYNPAFNYNTVAVNTTNLKNSLNSFPANSTVYVSIMYTPKGRDIRLSNGGIICNPFNICCPPNCNPPIPKSIALPESSNPFAF